MGSGSLSSRRPRISEAHPGEDRSAEEVRWEFDNIGSHENKIHRLQTYNAFGEVSSETDGNKLERSIMSNIGKYSYLWDGSQDGWVLLVAPDLQSGFCIFNALTSNLLHIDDEKLNNLLCERMKAAGCKVIDSFPVGDSVVEVKPV